MYYTHSVIFAVTYFTVSEFSNSSKLSHFTKVLVVVVLIMLEFASFSLDIVSLSHLLLSRRNCLNSPSPPRTP